jgi:lipopolysaccharide export system permease protein
MILHRYLIREILKNFAMVIVVVVGIYLAVDFFEKIDDFMTAGLPVSRALSYLLYKVPFVMAQITPVGVLLSVLIVFGLMNKHHELIALKSSGVSLYFLLRPVVIIGAVVGFGLFVLSEVLVPLSMDQANRIWREQVRKESAVTTREHNIWIKGNRQIVHIKYYHPEDHTLYGMSLYRFDAKFRLIQRMDAKKAVFASGQWVLSDVMEQTLDAKGKSYVVAFRDQIPENLDFKPIDMQRVVKKSEEMGYFELSAYIDRVVKEGYDATHYRVDLDAKIAFPFICIVMSLLGAGIAMGGKKLDGLTMSIAYGITVVFCYWIFYSFCVSLGYGEMLPPVVSVWVANLVFLALGCWLLLRAE